MSAAWQPEYLEKAVLTKWYVGRLDTLEIARRLGVEEPEVCRIVARAQDRQRARRRGSA